MRRGSPLPAVLSLLLSAPLAAQSPDRLHQEACDAGQVTSCGILGLMLERGEGVAQDLARAVGLQERACDGGAILMCNHLGALLWQGELVPQSFGPARSAFERACSGGLPAGCINLGVMLREGHGAEPDFAGALSLFEQACLAGHAEGCAQVERTSPPLVPYSTPPSILNRQEVLRALIRRYPRELRDAGIRGTVRVYFLVNANGSVGQARLASSSRIRALDAAALSVAEVFRFTPALDEVGEPKTVWVSFPIAFEVR
jgi:TonB family protein